MECSKQAMGTCSSACDATWALAIEALRCQPWSKGDRRYQQGLGCRLAEWLGHEPNKDTTLQVQYISNILLCWKGSKVWEASSKNPTTKWKTFDVDLIIL